MKKIYFVSSFMLIIINVSNAQTLSFGPELGGVLQHNTSRNDKKLLYGFNTGIYLNYGVFNDMGVDVKVMYERLTADIQFVKIYPFLQYFGNNYTQIGIAPLILYPKLENGFDFSKTEFGLAFSFGNKYLGLNLSLYETKGLDFTPDFCANLSAHIRFPIFDFIVKK